MRVATQVRDSEIHVELLDDDGTAIPTVSPFLRHLRARGCSPNTLLAYAHDLRRLLPFLRSVGVDLEDFTPARPRLSRSYLRDLPWRREQELAAGAAARGWERERERHACAARRVEQLLAELGESLTDGPSDPIR